jgi:hypothetical protein
LVSRIEVKFIPLSNKLVYSFQQSILRLSDPLSSTFRILPRPPASKSGRSHDVRLEVAGFMRLVIEHIGAGPRGGELVSVAHYGEENGDLMRDPEIVFEVAAGTWHPVSIQQDYVGSYREAVSVGEDGIVFIHLAEVRDIQAFARVWDRDLKHQGFVDAAREV